MEIERFINMYNNQVVDVSEIIPPNEIRGLKTPSTTEGGMISEHVKNHPTK